MSIHSVAKLNSTSPSICLWNPLSKWCQMTSSQVTFIYVIGALYHTALNQNQNLVSIWSADMLFFCQTNKRHVMQPLYKAVTCILFCIINSFLMYRMSQKIVDLSRKWCFFNFEKMSMELSHRHCLWILFMVLCNEGCCLLHCRVSALDFENYFFVIFKICSISYIYHKFIQ